MIHETIPLPLEGLPEGTRQNGYEDFVVQDLKIEAHNVCYRRLRYLLPDGSSRTAPLPAHIQGHFGPGLRSYVVYQHHPNGVTQPLIHEELLDLGIDLSTGQIDRLLTEGHDSFHEPKDALLPAAREVSSYFQADDTGTRHLGKNAYTTVIANPLFASFTTTGSKSRVNFLELLAAPHKEYVWGEDALMYAECQGLSLVLRARLASAARQGIRIIFGDKTWERQLAAWKIHGDEPRRLVTEVALFGTLMHYGLYVGQPLVSDDAGQFKISGLLHGLCWLHAEQSIRKLVPLSPWEQEAIDGVRDAVWKYYQRLRAYKESPTPQRKAALERDFDHLFRRRTGFADLNDALRRIHEKRDDLLLVLDRPEIPLHNNLSESDIREWARKRKISAGTRSELGRRCRDTFVSLKKTCRKLGVSFWRYLQDRIRGAHEILCLAGPHAAGGPGNITYRNDIAQASSVRQHCSVRTRPSPVPAHLNTNTRHHGVIENLQDGDLFRKQLPCPFLATDNRCTIYEVRPRDCAEYPHTQKKGFTFRPHGIASNSPACPAVFYIVEQMRVRRQRW